MFGSTTGKLLQTFEHPTPGLKTFGDSAAAFGSDVLIGATASGAYGISGTVFLFDGSTGDLLQTFQSPTPSAFDVFGISIAAVGDHVLIGAQLDDTAGEDAGAAYLFDGTTGDLLRTFLQPTPEERDQFGISIAAVGSNVLIGAPKDDTGGTDAGAAYLFDISTGDLLHTFLNPTPEKGDFFGGAVAVLGNDILIGASRDNTAGENAGAVYLFQGPGIASDLTGNGFVDFEDLTLLLANWNQEVGSGLGNLVDPATTPVNFEDLTVLLADWTGPAPGGAPGAALDNEAVPEPSTLALAPVAALALVLRLRRPPACRGACR